LRRFTDYVFEDSATTILKENPKLKPEFEQKKQVTQIHEQSEAQLDWFTNIQSIMKRHICIRLSYCKIIT
jgi:adenine specific DNA methylase Mod